MLKIAQRVFVFDLNIGTKHNTVSTISKMLQNLMTANSEVQIANDAPTTLNAPAAEFPALAPIETMPKIQRAQYTKIPITVRISIVGITQWYLPLTSSCTSVLILK